MYEEGPGYTGPPYASERSNWRSLKKLEPCPVLSLYHSAESEIEIPPVVSSEVKILLYFELPWLQFYAFYFKFIFISPDYSLCFNLFYKVENCSRFYIIMTRFAWEETNKLISLTAVSLWYTTNNSSPAKYDIIYLHNLFSIS